MSDQTLGICTVLLVTRTMVISSDLGYCKTTDSGMAFGRSPYLEDTTTPGDSLVIWISPAMVAAQLSDTHIATGCSLGPGHLCGLRQEHCPQTSIDLSCSMITDPDMVPGSSLGSDVILGPGGSIGHSDQHGPQGSMAIRH